MTHNERVYHHLYVESKSPLENAECIASLEELMEELQAENARLRSQCADLVDERERLFRTNVEKNGEILRLAAENAKLRELCADMNKAAHMLCEAWEGSCSKEAEGMSLHAVCPISDTNELCVFGKLYDRMRELGVEVDG